MKRLLITTLLIIGFSAPVAMAEIYRYTDDDGQLWFTDRLSAIPEKYREQINQATPSKQMDKSNLHSKPRDDGIKPPDSGGLRRLPTGNSSSPKKTTSKRKKTSSNERVPSKWTSTNKGSK